MNIVDIAKNRYTTKLYDPSRKIPTDQFAQLCEVLRLSPSSVNSQPWHFVVAASDEAKARLMPAIADFNRPRVQDASHVIVFCARKDLDDEHLQNLLAQEQQDGRFVDDNAKEATNNGRRYFVGLNSQTPEQQLAWESNQVYLALGNLLLAAQALAIDSTPIEGFDRQKMDQVLGLAEQGLTSLVVASLGYHSESDLNHQLPKSRLPQQQVFTFL